MANQVKIPVSFDINKADLTSLKMNLQQLKKLSLSDLMKINQTDRATATQTFTQIRTQAENVQQAIKAAFNAKLNTVNIETFNKSLKQAGSSVQKVYETFKKGGVAGQNAFRSLTSQVLTTNVQLKQTHTLLDNIATTLSNTIKWNIASSAVNTLTNSVQQAWGYVKSLDTSLNDIRIVTGKSADEMANFAIQANEAAKSLGKTTVDYTKAALIYAQQGLTDDEIATRAAITLKAANVTGQSADEVSEQLTSVWNGYKVTAEQTQLYIDRLAAVAANTASDLEELSTGMSKVAAAAAAMGVGEDQLAAQLSTIISVTRQAPESVGTALRTVYARISDIKAGIDEDGVSLGNYSGKMAALGFNVLDVNGKLRDMGQVIEEIGGKWQTLTREQQVSLAQTMAGQRQYSNLIALFDNFQEYNRALGIAQNAAGTLQKQQDIYLESTRAHLNQLKASVEDLYDSSINPDSLEPLIDGLAEAAQFGAKFVDSIGGGGALLTSLGAIGVSVFSNQIAKGINTTITNFEIAKRNAQQFDAILQTIQQWKGIDGLDKTTQSLLQNRQQILSLSKLMTPEQFSGMQELLNNITQTSSRLASLKDQKGFLDSAIKKITGLKTETEALNVVMKDATAQERIVNQLRAQENEFTATASKINAYRTQIQQMNIENEKVPSGFDKIKESIGRQIVQISKLAETNGPLESHRQQIANLIKEFGGLKSDIPADQLKNKLMSITATLQGLYTSGGNAAGQLREKLTEEFAETVRSLGYNEKEAEEILNKLTKAFQDQQRQIQRAATLKGITDFIGSFARLGASIKQIQNLGSIWGKNSDLDTGEKILETVTNLGMALPMVTAAAKTAGQALNAMFGISAGPAGVVIGLITAVTAGLLAAAKAADEANEAAIKLRQTQIQNQNKRQEQIQTNKKLYSSIEDLNKKYQDGQITRYQLRSAIEDLCDQYNIESSVIQGLTTDYDNLTEAIKRKRIADAEQGIRSATNEIESAQDLILKTGKKGSGYQTNNNKYKLDIKAGPLGLSGNTYDDEEKIARYIIEATQAKMNAFDWNLHIETDFNSDSIIALYDNLNKAIDRIQKDTGISEKERYDSEYYKNAIAWLEKMQPAIQKYRQAQQDLTKYQTQLNILRTAELNNIETANDYLEQRQNIINAIQQVLNVNNDKTSNAEDMADTYLRDNYRKLYVQFDETSQYIQKVKQKIGTSNKAIEQLIAQMDPQHFALLADIVNLENIDDWGTLEKRIREISKIDLSNLEPVVGDGVVSSNQAAADKYTFLQSLEDQIKSGKSISSTEFKRIGEQAPELQSYFTMLANGQYKMTEDAKTFYNTIDSLKLDGFRTVIQQINNEIQRTERLSTKSFDENALRDYAYDVRKEYTQRSLGGNRVLTDDAGNIANIAPQVNEYIEINEKLAQQQIDYLRTARAKDQQFIARLNDWETTIFENADLQQRKEAVVNLSNAVNEELEKQTYSLDELKQSLKQTQQAMYDALFPTDVDIDNSTLHSLTQTIQGLANQNNDFAETLEKDARSAEDVAESILRFNNAIEDMVKNYETWLGVLSSSQSSIQQIAEIIGPLRDAYADLLDLEGSSLSDDFLQNAENLALMKAAIDGNIESYEELRAIAAQDIIAHITFDSEQAFSDFQDAYQSVFDWIQNNDFDTKIHIGANLDQDQLLSALTDLINATQMTAAQASDLLHSAFGIDAEVIHEEKPVTTKQEWMGATSQISNIRIPGFNPLNGTQTTWTIPSVRYKEAPLTTETTQMVAGTGLKIINARKTTGGKIKWTHSSQGAGHAGVTRRAAEAEKIKNKQVKADTSTKETKKPIQDNRDIYHDINLQLEQISRNLNRVQKQQDRLYGKQLIDNLNKQSQILEQHKAKLKEKQLLQKQDLELKAQQLRMLGILVNTETGNIDNYLQSLGAKQGVINGLIAQYNSIVGSYNATTDKQAKDVIKDQLTEIERAIKDAETDYKNLESKIKNYDSLRKAYEDITDTIEEQLQKQIEINITKFKMQVEIRLEMGEAEREWNKFKKEVLEGTDVLKDIGFDSLLKGATQNYRDVFSYFDIHGNENGEIQSLTKQVTDTLAEITKIENGQESTYGDNMAQAMEDLNNYASLLQDSMISVRDLVNQVDQAYLDMYDDIQDQMDKQIEDYEFLNGLIEHDMDLLQLLYGDKQFEAMNSYYDEQHRNQLNQIGFLREAVALVKERWQLQEAAGNTNAAEKLKQQYKDLVQDMNALVEDAIRTLQDKYTNAINQIFDSLDKRVTGGLGTNYLQMEWELINKNADEYLDTINSAFALQELQTKFQKAIDDTQNVKNQQVLTNLMEEQLSQLRAKDKLTQYDVDRAEKLLEIEQARMALEDARSAKTSLRLKRDSQGNYSYVYAANEEDVSTAQDQLAKAQNDLYNFDKEAYRNNLNDMLSAWKDFQSRYKEIVLDTSLTEEERVRQLALLREQYGEYINNKAEENEVIRTNLMESAFIDYATLYENDYNAYASMIESEKDILMSELVPTWDDGIQQMINKFAAEGGFIPTCEQAFRELDQATIDYENQLDILESVAGANFKEIKEGALDPTTIAFQELVDKNSDLINKIKDEQIPAIENLKNTLDSLLEKYKAVWEAAEEASRRAHEALQNQRELAAQEAANASKNLPETAPINNPTLPAAPKTVTPTSVVSTPTSTINKSTTPTSNEQVLEQTLKTTAVQKASTTNSQEMYKNLAGAIYWGLWGSKIKEVVNDNMVDVFGVDKGTVYFRQAWKIYSQPKYHPGKGSALFYDYSYEQLKKKYKNRLSTYTQASFDTGGYTGSWGSEGKLAILHQKELVLNAHDTQNLLDSVSVLRSIVSKLGGNISARLDGLKNNVGLVASAANQIDQNVNIQASFPNVNSKKEIEEAFSELVNLAAQRASKIR